MTAPIIQAQYDALDEIAQRFQYQGEAQANLKRLLQQRFAGLQQGGWVGRGAQDFFSEMEGEVFPAIDRLIQAMDQAVRVTSQIKQILLEAEREAAAPFKLGESIAEGRSSGGAGVDSPPPPRVYFVNGINSAGNVPGYVGDDQSVDLMKLFQKWGYDESQLVTTLPIFLRPKPTNLSGTHFGGLLSPVDWITGAGADLVNKFTRSEIYSSIYGSAEVLREYMMGSNGPYTQDVYNNITDDLQRHPLAPGQTIVLVGHSGGGAVVANLAGMIENQLGHDVTAVITMGSPVSNYDEAGRYAETIVQIRHQQDLIGTPIIRSSESRLMIPGTLIMAPIKPSMLPAWVISENMARHVGDHPHVVDIILGGYAEGVTDAHGSYMNPDRPASREMMERLRQLFPEMHLATP